MARSPYFSTEEPPPSPVTDLSSLATVNVTWQKIDGEDLDLRHVVLLPSALGRQLMQALEKEVVYFTGALARVRVHSRWRAIPRQQVSFGDPGRQYKFSGITVPALPWPAVLLQVRDLLERVTGFRFNFVLVNRYRNGGDHMSEHRDKEVDLDPSAPIASLSLGQARDFVLRHADARKPVAAGKRNIDKVTLKLTHGTLLLLNPPTNKFWYHSLPPRKSCRGVRINLTFRKLK